MSPEIPFHLSPIEPKTKKRPPVHDLNKNILKNSPRTNPQKRRQKQLNITIFHHFFKKFRTKPPPLISSSHGYTCDLIIPSSHPSLPFTWIFWAPQKRWRAASKLARAKWRLERLTGQRPVDSPYGKGGWFLFGGRGNMNEGQWKVESTKLFVYKKHKSQELWGFGKKCYL